MAPPSPELLLPPLAVTAPPAKEEEVKPAEIVTEPPTAPPDKLDEPTDNKICPPWPLPPPPAPVVTDTPPEFPDVEAPVDSVICPETPLEPASEVTNASDPELVSVLAPLEMCMSPPRPDALAPAEK
jgi:hypothetical protein